MTDTVHETIVAVASTPYFADRGCHVRIMDVLNNFQACGCAVTLITYPLGRDAGRFHIRRTLRVPWYRTYTAGPNIHKWYLDILLFVCVGCSVLRHRPDTLYCFLHESALIGIIWRVVFRIPVVFDCQGSLTEELIAHGFMPRHGLRHRLLFSLERFLYRHADTIVTSSASLAQWIRNAVPDLHTPVCELTDGVDTSFFYPRPADADLRARLGLAHSVKIIGFIGLLTVYQGIEDFLAVAQTLCAERADVGVLIIGFPDEKQYMERMRSAGYGDRCVCTGRVRYEDIPAYISLMTVAVSPKLSSTEANGKILNFMAMGTPVACYDTPVNRSLLGDLGFYAPAGNVSSLTEAVRSVLDMPPQKSAQQQSAVLHYVHTHHAWENRHVIMRTVLARVTHQHV